MAWNTIESDPAVFSEMLERLGVRGVEVAELWGLDESAFESLGGTDNIKGLYFLFKWQKDKRTSHAVSAEAPEGVFFAKQTISNACGTLALLHVLLNRPEIDVGTALADYKAFAADLPPDLRGDLLGSCDPIRVTHNLFARPEPFEAEERAARGDDDVYHFIAYTQVGDKLYELDGLKPAPIQFGTVAPGEDWVAKTVPEIARRMEEYAGSEIRFNLLALVRDRRCVLGEAMRRTTTRLEAVHALAESMEEGALAGSPNPEAVAASLAASIPEFNTADSGSAVGSAGAGLSASSADHFEPADNVQGLKTQYAGLLEEIERLKTEYAGEKEKRASWSIENERRRHNFVPFLMELLQQLASHGALTPMYEAGKKKAEEARGRARAAAREKKDAALAASGAGSAIPSKS